MAGELLTRWTVWLALLLYALALTLRIGAFRRYGWLAAARLCWTVGYAAFLLHVMCAFHFTHQWSHHAAHEHTAQRTLEVVGWYWGGGLCFNYLFVIVWGADVTWWWCSLERRGQWARLGEWLGQGFLGFMAFNATVVFGEDAVRWWGLATCVWLGLVWLRIARAPE